MQDVFTKINITPNYASGFTFTWSISSGLEDPGPWKYCIYEAESGEGPWIPLSPILVNQGVWSETESRLVSKDLVLFFMITLTTPKGTYDSHVITPYGDLDRREYLLAKEIMRREVLQSRTMAGTVSDLWIRSTWGPIATGCVDPITGDVLSDSCGTSYGTGRDPGYYGPVKVWTTYAPLTRDSEQSQDGTGVRQNYVTTVRLIGYPYLKDKDVLVDCKLGKRYLVDGVQHLTELRRVTIVQSVTVGELPVSDPLYRLGLQPAVDGGCTFE
jgi:hypothetical protein